MTDLYTVRDIVNNASDSIKLDDNKVLFYHSGNLYIVTVRKVTVEDIDKEES